MAIKTIAVVFAALVCFALPIGLGVALIRGERGRIRPLLLGAGTFFVFQLCLRLPLLQLVVGKTVWYSIMVATMPVASSLFAGVTAAVFEEGGRLLVMSFMMKKRRCLHDALAFGIGHGGFEAMALIGINIIATAILNPALMDTGAIFASSLERISSMTIHCALTLMVMATLRSKTPWGFFAALFFHTAVDFFCSISQYAGMGMWATEAVLLAVAALGGAYIYFAFKKQKQEISL